MLEKKEVLTEKDKGTTKAIGRMMRDMLIGSLSGAIGIYLTQPLDTVRVIYRKLRFSNIDQDIS